ncbi:MAG: family 16 glycoside hydrolase [Planctomycetota bacterium]|jgi:acetyl esterase/lipase
MLLTLLLVSTYFLAGCGVSGRQMLFNGKDFDGWKLYVEDSELDVAEVWSVKDGVVRCEGEPYGYMRTTKAYTDYKLHVEWRWPEELVNSGVLLHASEPDKIWIRSIEAQLAAGSAGDFILIGEGIGLTVDGVRYQDDDEPYIGIEKMHESTEKKPGEWNSYDIICNGNSIKLYVNGKFQNEGNEASRESGYICLQSEGSPIEFRNIYIEPSEEVSSMAKDKEYKEYQEFYKRVEEDEPYIGFFAAEEKCISNIDDTYFNARYDFFVGVRSSDEEVEGYMERFINFCEGNGYLNDGCEEEWEKTLTILSFVLYANKPIFEFSADNIIEHRNLVFAEYPNKKLELDLFLPKEPADEPVPCIVCIHGGGWRVNRRIWFEPFAMYFASKGMAAVTIDYRMLPAVEIIDCVYDTKAAIRWVRANADEYGIDPDRIGAIGASAGGHLIALLAATANVPELEGTGGNPGVSTEIQAAVGFATPAFKIDSESSQKMERFGMTEEHFKLISPYENISEDSAPLFLVHGTKDPVVDPKDSQDLYDKYKEVGAHAELKWIEDQGHDFYERNSEMAIQLATDFFKEQFGLE